MTWIKTIQYDDADPNLAALYDRIAGKNQQIDNILLAHSLRPHTLTGHMTLYKNVLHNFNNQVPKSFLETLGVLVSLLNRCDYCVDHHSAGLRKLLADDLQTNKILDAVGKIVEHQPVTDDIFTSSESEAIKYTKLLTLHPDAVTEENIGALRESGYSDGEILEINQVVAYFCYANRTVLGLGITTGGEELGLNPGDSNDPTNWNHD